jgi:hypothetical protein
MARRTFLAPGQRYADITTVPWRIDQQLTILQIGQQPDGRTVVTYRCFNGAEETTAATQFEAAIARGLLVPVVGIGRIASC